jgi:hypothetical protein
MWARLYRVARRIEGAIAAVGCGREDRMDTHGTQARSSGGRSRDVLTPRSGSRRAVSPLWPARPLITVNLGTRAKSGLYHYRYYYMVDGDGGWWQGFCHPVVPAA